MWWFCVIIPYSTRLPLDWLIEHLLRSARQFVDEKTKTEISFSSKTICLLLFAPHKSETFVATHSLNVKCFGRKTMHLQINFIIEVQVSDLRIITVRIRSRNQAWILAFSTELQRLQIDSQFRDSHRLLSVSPSATTKQAPSRGIHRDPWCLKQTDTSQYCLEDKAEKCSS